MCLASLNMFELRVACWINLNTQISSYFYPAMIYYLNLKTMKQKHHEVLHGFTHTDHLTSCEYVLLSSKAKCSFNTLSHSRQSLTLQSWQEICNGPNIQEVDNVIPPRPFCAFPNVNATFRKSSLSRPFGALPNVNATNTWAFFGVIFGKRRWLCFI